MSFYFVKLVILRGEMMQMGGCYDAKCKVKWLKV